MKLLSLPKHIRHITKDKVTLPRFLTYTVTFTCNARCIMCDSWKKPSPNDLELTEIDRIWQQLPQMDAVRLTGGEPFVRKDIGQIAQLTEEHLRPSFLHITSNGFLTDRIVSFCENRKKKTSFHLLISVDGMQEKHNQIRGHKKAWHFVQETVKTLAPLQKKLKMHLSINQTIVDAEGAEQYKDLHAWLKPFKVRHNLVMAYDSSATYSTQNDVEVAPKHSGEFHTFGDFSPQQLQKLLDQVESDLNEQPIPDRLAKKYYIQGIRNRLLEGFGSPNPKCVSLKSHLRIFPDGSLPVCQFNSQKVGNLRHQSFEEIWFGSQIQKHRNWVSNCPGCWAECEILPNAFYSGDLLKRTMLPKRMAKSIPV